MALDLLDDAKEHLNITSVTHDDEIERFVAVACAVGERYTGRTFGLTTVTETHRGGSDTLILRRIPVVSIDEIVEDGIELATSDYALSTESGTVTRIVSGSPIPWVGGVDEISVTYDTGYAEQPADDVQGVLEMVRHMWDTQRGSMAMMPRGDDGWNPAASFSLPARVAELWDGARVPGFA